jgi:predicted acyl esterase
VIAEAFPLGLVIEGAKRHDMKLLSATVEVTSSDFPRYDRNLNTGGVFGLETQGQVANNTLFHDGPRVSHILLPIRSA